MWRFLRGAAICLAAGAVLSGVATVAAVAAGAQPGALAQPGAKNQDSVSLNFAWPKNLRGRVEYTLRKTRKGGGKTHNMKVSGSYAMKTAPAGDGLRISAYNATLGVTDAQRPRGSDASLQQFLMRATRTPPSFVVDNGGEFRRIDGLKEFRINLRRALNEMTPDMTARARAQANRAVAPMMSEGLLTASVANNWYRDVGAWLGAKLDHGDVYESRHESPMPVLGNRSLTMVTTFRFVRRLPCRTGEKTSRCVELEMRSFIDADGLKKTLREYHAEVAGEAADVPVFKNLSTTTTVRLITEPGTLVPHQVHIREATTALVTLNGRDLPSERIQETRTVYSY